jgi:hypothetical protein
MKDKHLANEHDHHLTQTMRHDIAPKGRMRLRKKWRKPVIKPKEVVDAAPRRVKSKDA